MKKILSAAAVFLAALSLVGCTKDANGNDNVSSGNVPDPAGTVMVNLQVNGASSVMTTASQLSIDSPGNFYTQTYYGDIIDVGQANGLGNLNTSSIPQTGWAKKCAVQAGHLYILRGTYGDYAGKYVGVYVVSWNGSVVTIKWCAFEPGVGWK